jgi:Ca2+-binding RTX toxin-like protein
MATDQSDRISGLDSDDIIYGGLGSDRIFGNNGNDILYGDLGIKSDNSDIQPAYGLTFSMNDTIAGGAGNDKIYGNLGNDKLYGDEGDDVIWGGDGDDEIWGGYGNDTLYGGAGKDAFVLVRGQGADIIMDFKSEDVLGCAGALTYSSLKFTPINGDTLITDKATSELLATLKGFIGTPNDGGLF